MKMFILFFLQKTGKIKSDHSHLYNSVIWFFYRNVLHILREDIRVPRIILDHRLLYVLTLGEINMLLDATADLKYRPYFPLYIPHGLCVSEALHLYYNDIFRTYIKILVKNELNGE